MIVKKEAKTEEKYGKRPEDRDVNELLEKGVINVDKPKGPTTHQVADYVKRILHLDKAGHCGSLDPAVTGVVVVGLGNNTKIVQTLLGSMKEYVGVMHIHKDVPEEEVKKAFKKFTGKIKQLPPIKSAVKRVERTREVYYFEILEIQGKDVLFRVGCQAGTYIRKLCHDIGKELGTGAHMAELRRTKLGPFDESTAVTLQDLQDAFVFWKEGNDSQLKKMIQPMEKAVGNLLKIWVFDTTIDSICHGAQLKVPGISKFNKKIEKNQLVAIMSLKDELVAIGNAEMTSREMLEKEMGLAVKTIRVFMEPGIYPKIR
jgi:H/ACA ribonucleoprotein complex subunit 4